MPNTERSGEGNKNHNGTDSDVTEILALYLAGIIKREDMSPENQQMLGFYIGLMNEDPRFAAQVNAKKNEILGPGVKKPLFPQETIKELSKRKRRKRHEEWGRQLPLWGNPPSTEARRFESLTTFDPEKSIFDIARNLDDRYLRTKGTPIEDDMKMKRMQLREYIGLPVARGKDPHVNDDYYKLMVKRVYKYDTFGIFAEYDRVLTKIPVDLQEKIVEVRGLINTLLNDNLNRREKNDTYNRFLQEYREKWDLIE